MEFKTGISYKKLLSNYLYKKITINLPDLNPISRYFLKSTKAQLDDYNNLSFKG